MSLSEFLPTLRGAVVALLFELTIAGTLVARCYGRVPPVIDDVSFGRHHRLRRSADNATTTIPPTDFGSGTTANLREIFMGRCYDYECSYCTDEQKRSYDCLRLWEIFNSSFAYRDPCTTSPDDFSNFVTQAFFPLPDHETMFYSGTYNLAMTIGATTSGLTNVEHTLLGRIVDGLTFCGQADAPGVNYDTCPYFGACEYETQASFWDIASKNFAGNASGDVTVILDGSRSDGAYRPTSFFRSKEVPNIDPSRVASLTAHVVHSLDGTVVESCVTGSLLILQEDIQAKGIKFECIENPSVTRHAQCLADPEHEFCLQQERAKASPSCSGSSTTRRLPSSLLTLLLSILALVYSNV